MRGLRISTNAMGFKQIWLHYSADPEKDIQHEDPATRERAQTWLAQAKQRLADPNLWEQEYEISFWVSAGARVFPEFRESIHAPLSLVPNRRKVLYRAWDFGWHAPACLVASLDGQDRLCVLREMVGHDCSTREFAHRVLKDCAAAYPHHAPGWQDFCDPAGQQVRPTAERAEQKDVEVLGSLGIFPTWEYGWSRKDGRSLIHQLLTLRTDQTPGLYVDPHHCPTLLQSFLGKYVYPESKDGKAKDEPDESNHPWADVMASLRYLCTGLYTALGLRRFKYQPVIPVGPMTYMGYGTPLLRGSK